MLLLMSALEVLIEGIRRGLIDNILSPYFYCKGRMISLGQCFLNVIGEEIAQRTDLMLMALDNIKRKAVQLGVNK